MNITQLPKLVQKYLQNMKRMKNRQQGSVNVYAGNLNLFFEYIKDKKKWDCEIKNITIEQIKSITSNNIESFILYCEKEGNAASTRVAKIIAIRMFFNYLIKKEKLITNNPMDDIDSPKLGKRLPKPLNISQVEALLKAIGGQYKERDLAMIRICLDCGLRVSELVDIDLDHIEDDELRIIGKGNKERQVYLSDKCLNAIQAYLNVRPYVTDKALFISKQNKRISIQMAQTLVKNYLTEIGAGDKSIHALRHTFATIKLSQGVDIRTLCEMMGHESIETTARYMQVNNETKKKAFKMSS